MAIDREGGDTPSLPFGGWEGYISDVFDVDNFKGANFGILNISRANGEKKYIGEEWNQIDEVRNV